MSKESESESIKLPRLRLRHVLFESVNVICLYRGEFICTFSEIICADIAFKFYRHTHMCINRGQKAMTSKGGSNGAKRGHVPSPSNNPENGTKSTYSST